MSSARNAYTSAEALSDALGVGAVVVLVEPVEEGSYVETGSHGVSLRELELAVSELLRRIVEVAHGDDQVCIGCRRTGDRAKAALSHLTQAAVADIPEPKEMH